MLFIVISELSWGVAWCFLIVLLVSYESPFNSSMFFILWNLRDSIFFPQFKLRISFYYQRCGNYSSYKGHNDANKLNSLQKSLYISVLFPGLFFLLLQITRSVAEYWTCSVLWLPWTSTLSDERIISIQLIIPVIELRVWVLSGLTAVFWDWSRFGSLYLVISTHFLKGSKLVFGSNMLMMTITWDEDTFVAKNKSWI